jgi:hypothetical protein
MNTTFKVVTTYKDGSSNGRSIVDEKGNVYASVFYDVVDTPLKELFESILPSLVAGLVEAVNNESDIISLLLKD